MIGLLLKWILWLLILAIAACTAFYAYVVYATAPYAYDSIEATPATQVALVLGASVTGSGALSTVLQERADRAVVLYKAHKVGKILVTGDNATLSHDEVDPVGKYLAAAGVPKSDIFLDHAGFDTYSSMYRARDVFGVTTMTVVSQPFHLPRAVYIARKLGITAYASPADTTGSTLYNYAREIPATAKAEFDILFSRQPKFLGTQYLVSGDGETTWGGFSSTAIWQ